jgi:antitoxin VapB
MNMEALTHASIPNPVIHSLSAKTTTVFTSGNSQAVRLPKEFRFDSKQVFIERRGEEIVLRERRPTFGEALKNFKPLSGEEGLAWDNAMSEIPKLPAQAADWLTE